MKITAAAIFSLMLSAAASGFSCAFATEQPYAKETEISVTPNATFTISAGWRFDEETKKLVSPEGDVIAYLLEKKVKTGSEEELDALSLSTWKEINPQFNYPITERLSPPPEDGWERIRLIYYDIPVKENRTVFTVTRVFHGTAYILLVDSSHAGLSKRGPQLDIVAETWHPPGLEKEDLSQNKIKLFSKANAREMSQFIEHAMKELNVPGASVAIIQNDQVVYRHGFGVKKLGQKDKVTPQTLFMIGSTTKPLTTLMLAKLVEQGKLKWDTRIQDVLPAFKLADEEITSKFQVKHTACACTGMPRRDTEVVWNVFQSAEDSLKLLHSMRPTTGFGETFQYSNNLVAVGGFLGGNVYNKGMDLFTKYENAITNLVFEPLGMQATRVKPRKSDSHKLASPHLRNYDGKMLAFPQTIEDWVYISAPAGSIWSNVDDLSRYVMMELRKGRSRDGRPLFAEEQIIARRTPQVKISETASYGLGLSLEKDKGLSIIGHAGNLTGFTHDLFFLPDYQVGMIVQTNAGDVNSFRDVLKQKLMELLLGAQERSEDMLQFSKNAKKQAEDVAKKGVSLEAKDNQWIDSFVGSYINADIGNVKIVKEGSSFKFVTPKWSSDIATKTETTGEKLLFLTTPPYLDLILRVSEENGKRLIFDDQQVRYEFSSVK